ncbi:MAG: hypothetical protein Q4B12_01240 [Bowdeniella nasicola]|nr:hypothetical protein [Bowdeniella nasicola]
MDQINPRCDLLRQVLVAAPTDAHLWHMRTPTFSRTFLTECLRTITPLAERGAALLQESAVARETAARIRTDWERVLQGAALDLSELPTAAPAAVETLETAFADAQLRCASMFYQGVCALGQALAGEYT